MLPLIPVLIDVLDAPSTGGVFVPTTLVAATSEASLSDVWESRCDVYYGGVKQRELQITAGSISEDETRQVRWTCQVTLSDPTGELAPSDMRSLLAPNGVEIWLYAGRQEDLQPVGVYQVVEPETVASGSGATITLHGQDRSSIISAARWEAPYPLTAGAPVHEVIAAAAVDRYPDVQMHIDPTNYFVPAGIVWGLQAEGDPWKDMLSLATSAGLLLRFDQQGVLRMAQAVEDAAPVARLIEGNGWLLGVTRSLNKGHITYNGVIARGESPGRPSVQAVVWDDDPSSPTYYLGPYGKKPRYYASEMMTTADQAEGAARSILATELGARESVQVSCVPDPNITAGSVVVLGHGATKTDGNYTVSSRSLNLKAGPMGLTCRERRLV